MMSLFGSPRRVGADKRLSGQRRRRRRQGSPWVGLETLESRLAPAVSIWSGAVDGLWSNQGNWDTPPVSGSDLIFPDGAGNTKNTNDLTPGTTFASLTIAGSGYDIDGAAITLDGSLEASQTSGSGTLSLPIGFTGTASVRVDRAGAVLVLGGVISGSAGLSKQGDGELDLAAPNDYDGITTIDGGLLVVDGAQAGSAIIVNAGTFLQGAGTVGSITVNSGTVSPGHSSPAILTASGDLTFDPGSTFTVILDGGTAGVGYSQLQVTGQVNLDNAVLQPLLGFTPVGQDQFLIINNTGSAAISGTFAGLPEGATFVVSGEVFQISYVGGDGNDVVLTHLLSSTTTLVASPSAVVYGEPVTLTATVAASDPSVLEAPTGTVEFFQGAISLGIATLSDGIAVLEIATLPVGGDPIIAQYRGDTLFAPGDSPAIAVDVTQASTLTTLDASPNPSVFGQTVTLTATVAVSTGSGTPTGLVEFFSGSTSLGTATLNGGVATLETSALAVGNNVITAQYQGDPNFVASTSPEVAETVNEASTSTALTATPNPAGLDQPVTLTATVTAVGPGAGTPTGLVEFFSGSISLGTATLSDGVATLQTSALPLGVSSITVQYQGDPNFTASTSPEVSLTVSPASTTTLVASPSAIVYGEPVTLTATVAAVDGSATPTGNVIFMSGTTPLGTAALIDGVATLTISSLPGGAASITAQYQGDSTFAGSASPATTVTVAQAGTTTTLNIAPNPLSLGDLVTLTVVIATDSASLVKPSGTVQFFNGSVLLGTAVVTDGVATLTTASLPLGTSSITAQYLGDTNYSGSTSSAVTATVNAASTTTLVATPTSTVLGQPVTLTATVVGSDTSGIPTGTVEFFLGTTSLGTALLSNGVAVLTTSALPVGSASITARYLGDNTFGVSTAPAVTVTVAQASTTTTLTVGPTSTVFGQAVTLTATVVAADPSAGQPSGTVQFYQGTTLLGSGVLSNGTATLTTTALPVGTAAITAQYLGDGSFLVSTSAAVTATVGQSSTTVTVASSKPNPASSEAVTLTATVAVSGSGAGTPTGTVLFYSNGVLLGSGTLSNGQATLTTTALAIGFDAITAVYQGDGNFTAASSETLTIVVGDQTERLLNQVYLVVLQRPIEQRGLDYWRTQLEMGVPLKRVVNLIVNSREGRIAAVQVNYQTFLNRAATGNEVSTALSPASRSSGIGLSARVLGSRAFYETQGGGTIGGFLTALYQAVLGTDVPDAARARLTGELARGVSTAAVAQEVLLSPRGKASQLNFLYENVLGRPADSAGLTYFLDQLNQGIRIRQVLVDLLSSWEFVSLFADNS
ncbi:Ig-like domain repeat protein [Singulisphaera acidiphila]|nr:Ig-like domain repeat protein [Singulisphaera acidiphila]